MNDNINEELAEEIVDEISDEAENTGEDIISDEEKIENYDQMIEENAALQDKYLRIYAEYDNFRKRTAKEKEELYAGATADVLKDILPVLDNFERALQYSGDDLLKVQEGLQMIKTQFADALARIGVSEIPAEGEQFDPELHHAVAHSQDESQPANTVTHVLQKGYIKGERVIREAMVKVVN